MADKPSLVHVEIFGQSYAVRAGAERGYVEQLAGFVDGQMKEVGRSTNTVDSVRIAVLAALNIADELFRCRAARSSGDHVLQQRAQLLADELAQALDD
jgi:cell division protein ZapA